MSESVIGWLNGNEAPLARLMAKHNVQTVLEIGSFLGKSAIFFASQPTVKMVTCIDRFEVFETDDDGALVQFVKDAGIPNPFYHAFIANITAAGYVTRVRPLRGTSQNVLKRLLGYSFDLIYIDGDHSYEGCLADILACQRLTNKVICGDDYAPRWPGVMRAVSDMYLDHSVDGVLWYKELKT